MKSIFYAVIIAFLLNKPYVAMRKWLKKYLGISERVAKAGAIVLVYLGAFGILYAVGRFVLPQLVRNVQMLRDHLDYYIAGLQAAVNQITGKTAIGSIDLGWLSDAARNYMDRFDVTVEGLSPKIMTLTTQVIATVAKILIAVVLSVYLLAGKRMILSQIRKTLWVYLPKKVFQRLLSIYGTVVEVFDNYVSGQLLEATILGILCSVGMVVLRFDYAGLVGFLIGITALIPIVGAYVGGAAAILLLSLVSMKQAVFFLAYLIILQQFENNVIYPRVVGRKMGLPGIWVMIGISLGGSFFGLAGMVLGVPVMTILYTLLKTDVNHKLNENKAKA